MGFTVREIAPDEHEAYLDCHLVGQTRRIDDERRALVLRQLDDPGCRLLAAFEGTAMVGVGLDFETELTLPGGATVPVGAITWIAVLPTHRRRGAMRGLLAEHHAGFTERGLAAGVLLAATSSLYGRYGYGCATWDASIAIDTLHGAFLTEPAPGSFALVPTGEIGAVCTPIWEEMRRARPGALARSALDWEWYTAFPGERYTCLFHRPTGEAAGYVAYTVDDRWTRPDPAGRVDVLELIAVDPEVEAALWRYLLDLDHVSEVRATRRPVDEPLRHRLVEPRRLRTRDVQDGLWLNALDPVRLLEGRRTRGPGRLVLAIDDRCWLAEADDDGAIRCVPASADAADVTLDRSSFACALLGGTSISALVGAGRASAHSVGALRAADTFLAWAPAPWCAMEF